MRLPANYLPEVSTCFLYLFPHIWDGDYSSASSWIRKITWIKNKKHLILKFSRSGSCSQGHLHPHPESQDREQYSTVHQAENMQGTAEGSAESQVLQLSEVKFKKDLDLGTTPRPVRHYAVLMPTADCIWVSPKFICWSPYLQISTGRYIWFTCIMGLAPLHEDMAVICMPGRGSFTDTKLAGTLIWDFLAPEITEIKVCCWSFPSVAFITAAWFEEGDVLANRTCKSMRSNKRPLLMEASREGGLSTLKQGAYRSALEPQRWHFIHVWTSTEPRGSLAFLWEQWPCRRKDWRIRKRVARTHHPHVVDLKEVKPEPYQSSKPPAGRQETIWGNEIHPQDQPPLANDRCLQVKADTGALNHSKARAWPGMCWSTSRPHLCSISMQHPTVSCPQHSAQGAAVGRPPSSPLP